MWKFRRNSTRQHIVTAASELPGNELDTTSNIRVARYKVGSELRRTFRSFVSVWMFVYFMQNCMFIITLRNTAYNIYSAYTHTDRKA
jgi:hypothetical protein